VISVSVHNKHAHIQPKSLPWTWAVSYNSLHHADGMSRDEGAARAAALESLLTLRKAVEAAIAECTGQMLLFKAKS